ncbi:sugar ABC transporter substrate-binding protein [Halalkalibacter kiskunsagensis]|uniref:Sugar ABC transporter substrate-binding protein n=1 Tax=Halalkalibacter kiskunsagensis TaxID=1548599 RepID=A0ABV6KD51_9BACI
MVIKNAGLKLLVLALLAIIMVSGCSDSTSEANSTTESDSSAATSSGAVYQWGDNQFAELVRNNTEGTTLKIGFAPPAASEFYDIIEHGANTMMNELSDRFGVEIEFQMAAPSEHQSVESQVATIENWTSQGYDAILVSSAGDFDSMNAVYEKAMAEGTMIYMFNMPAEMWDEDELKAVSVISYNNHYQAGYLVGQYAAEKLNGEGEILLIWGLPGHWSTSRKNGFLEAIDQYPGLEIVGEQRGDYVRDKGMQAAENLLQANPDVDFIYGENEEMAIGAVQAVEGRGMKLWDGEDGIIVVGADGLMSGYESIKNGKLTATVNVGPVDMGREFIKSVFMHQVLGYTIDKVQNVPTVIVDENNVDALEAYTDWALNTKR